MTFIVHDSPNSVTAETGPVSQMSRFVVSDPGEGITASGLGRSFAQGLSFGFSDELEAGIRSLFGDETYEQELADVRGKIKQFETENPGIALTSEILGSFVVPGGALSAGVRAGGGLLRTAARGAGIGAGSGALAGAGTAEGGVADRLQGAVTGGTVGTALGGVAAPVAQGLGRTAQIVGRQFRPQGRADQGIETVSGALSRDAIDPADLARAQRAVPQDEGVVLADLAQMARPSGGSATLRTARAAAGVEGPGAARASQFLESRQGAQGSSVSNFIDEALGTENFEAQSRALSQGITDRANRAYTGLHSLPDVPMDTALERFFRNPRVRRSYRRASADVFDETGEGLPPINDLLQATTIPVRVLDAMQRRFRRETDAAFKTGEASAASKKALRKRFLDIIDPKIPGFAETRRQFADGRAAEEALALGEKFASRAGTAQRQALRGFDEMSNPQKDLFRLGAAQRINDDVLNATAGADIGSRFLRAGPQRQIRRVFGDEQGQRLLDRFDLARTQTRTNRELLQGSRTAPLADDIAQSRELAGTVGNVLSGNVLGVVRDMATRVTRGINVKNSDEILRILLEPDPQKQAQIIRRLARSQDRTKQELSRRLTSALTGASGAGSFAGREIEQ